jgi:outer membrane protein OmpA-like peptidoglycan-associated protein
VKRLRFLVHPTLSETLPAVLAAAVLLLGTALLAQPAPRTGSGVDRRTTLAITYGENSSTTVDMVGSTLRPGLLGTADVERKRGSTRVKLHMGELPNPQSIGAFYTTYVVWAVAPEGQATNLAELPHSKEFNSEVTTSFQTFGLIVTAEPHSAVSLPSPSIIAANAARKDTVGGFQTGRLEYSGARYEVSNTTDMARRDFTTPLLVLGAHRAVELAKDAGAEEYASAELNRAEVDLGTLDRAWPRKGKLPKDLEGVARDVMRTSEHARTVALDRREQARLAAERSAANAQVASAQSQADEARARADRERDASERAKEQAEHEQQKSARARAEAEEAQEAARQARQGEELARDQADRARREAEEARGDKEKVQQQLFQSLSSILETRRETRGLIVSLSDVLFDFDRASLTPGAREKLSKLSGILLAYPGPYRLSTEGHTDSIGTHEYNTRLSRDRAESVQDYLLSAGVPGERVGPATGFAETRPVASNETAAGRQVNRRVEIVISELE